MSDKDKTPDNAMIKNDGTYLTEYPEQKGKPITEEDLANVIWGADIDTYPLRDKSEDPRWAINTMKVWFGFACVFLSGITLLLILGAVYD